jgi:hypothetical protein
MIKYSFRKKTEDSFISYIFLSIKAVPRNLNVFIVLIERSLIGGLNLQRELQIIAGELCDLT